MQDSDSPEISFKKLTKTVFMPGVLDANEPYYCTAGFINQLFFLLKRIYSFKINSVIKIWLIDQSIRQKFEFWSVFLSAFRASCGPGSSTVLGKEIPGNQ